MEANPGEYMCSGAEAVEEDGSRVDRYSVSKTRNL